jgi:hypothetical protein
MKIPDSIKISGHKIKIIKKKELFSDDERVWGLAYIHLKKIELAVEDLPESTIAETFLHEVLHMICSIHGIKLTEKENQAIALSLFQVIRDNKLSFGGREK